MKLMCPRESLVMLSGCKVSDLVDIEYHNRYNSNKDRTGSSASADSFEILDNTTLLSAHDDFILRVFDLNNGRSTSILPTNSDMCTPMINVTALYEHHYFLILSYNS